MDVNLVLALVSRLLYHVVLPIAIVVGIVLLVRRRMRGATAGTTGVAGALDALGIAPSPTAADVDALLRELEALVTQAAAQRAGPPVGPTAASLPPALQSQYANIALRYQRQMRAADTLARRRLEVGLGAIYSQAATAGIDLPPMSGNTG